VWPVLEQFKGLIEAGIDVLVCEWKAALSKELFCPTRNGQLAFMKTITMLAA
jgi:hypothetical protein